MRKHHNNAITIYELLIVLALLVIIFAMAWPAINNSFETSRLKSSADQIRAAWGKARSDAMQSGMPYVFRYQTEGTTYSLSKWNWNATADANGDSGSNSSGLESSGSGSSSESNSASGSNVNSVPSETQEELPEDIAFAEGLVASSARDASLLLSMQEESASDQANQTMIIFYPDGTSTDATVLLKNKRGIFIRIILRGLTGISRTGNPMTSKALLEEAQ